MCQPHPLRVAAWTFALLVAAVAPLHAATPWTARTWSQHCLDARRVSAGAAAWPEIPERLARAAASVRAGIMPLALLDAQVPVAGDERTTVREFGFAALRDRTLHGSAVTFRLASEDVVSDDPRPVTALAIDFDDGRGFRTVGLGDPVTVAYATPGTRTLRARLTRAGGETREADAAFVVEAVAVRAPDETLHVQGAPYNGVAGTGDAYIYLAPGHAAIVNPVVVPEGFDIDNTMNADELFTLLDQQGLADSIAARGMDAVVLNFTDATDDLLRNAQVLIALEQTVEQTAPGATVAMVGPSMGGLLGRYALAYMETHGIGHRVRTLFSFDAPHGGADIPLGIQHWTDFFADRSADAAFLRDRLNTAGARQMLLYHFSQPGAAPDPIRATWNTALAATGDWPQAPRLLGVANGSGSGQDQGFAPGAQLIRYEYSNSIVLTLTGDVWALPNKTTQTVFTGLQRAFFITLSSRNVSVTNTPPWDNAPGGWRATMAQMDSVNPGYGDIVALHPNHCFVPTVSALALQTTDPFYDVAGDPDLLAHTPYDEILVAPTNEEHVSISPVEAAWFLARIGTGLPTGVGPLPATIAGLQLAPPAPNPSRGPTRLDVTLPSASHATLDVIAVDGRRIARLCDGTLEAGTHPFRWDGRDAAGARVSSGLYFVRLAADGGTVCRRLVRLD